jgi:hypothetical protein
VCVSEREREEVSALGGEEEEEGREEGAACLEAAPDGFDLAAAGDPGVGEVA